MSRHEEPVMFLPLQLSADGSKFLVSPPLSQQEGRTTPAAARRRRPQPALGATTTTTVDDDAAPAELPTGVPLLQAYVAFLAFCAAAWLVYLVLPRGCKKAYFQKARRRQHHQQRPHNDRSAQRATGEDGWFGFGPKKKATTTRHDNLPPTTNNNRFKEGSAVGSNFSVEDSILRDAEARRRRDLEAQDSQDHENGVWDEIPVQQDLFVNTARTSIQQRQNARAPPMYPMSMAQSEADLENHETPAKKTSGTSHVPSPHHPQVNPLPAEAVWRECFRRLQGTGMRLTAHGVQCPSKRIWLQYSAEETTILWQTEFPRQVPSTAARASTVWVRGAMHRIPAGNVLYVDVGKKTTALLHTAAAVAPSTCFSLLTQAGSLDLQANSKLERDAVVSALSYILDLNHRDVDWRRMYDESSTIVNGSRAGGVSDYYNPASTVGVMSNIASDMFPPGPNEI